MVVCSLRFLRVSQSFVSVLTLGNVCIQGAGKSPSYGLSGGRGSCTGRPEPARLSVYRSKSFRALSLRARASSGQTAKSAYHIHHIWPYLAINGKCATTTPTCVTTQYFETDSTPLENFKKLRLILCSFNHKNRHSDHRPWLIRAYELIIGFNTSLISA